MVSEAYGRTGDTVDVTLSLENNPGIIAMGLRVHFDTTKLKLVEAVDAKTMPGGLFSNVLSSPFRMVWEDSLSLTDYKVNDVIATLRFEILEPCAVSADTISITYAIITEYLRWTYPVCRIWRCFNVNLTGSHRWISAKTPN